MADQEFPSQKTLLYGQLAFAHTLSQSGLHDSICLKCFRVVDSQPQESELALAEQLHICELFHLTVTPVVFEVMGEVKSDLAPDSGNDQDRGAARDSSEK